MNGHPLTDEIVGVDVGGTKTHLAAIDGAGTRRDAIVSSSHWRTGHLFSDGANLPRLAEWIRSTAVLDRQSRVVIGLRDCDTDAELEQARHAIAASLGLPVRIENDADLLAPASGDGPAIAMIVGTGAIVSARTAQGDRIAVDGYGWLFGDWGSGPGIVRDAIGRVLMAADNGELVAGDALARELFDHFGARDAAALAAAATIAASPANWGSAASRVFDAAAEGSALALDTIAAAADRLAASVDAVVRRGGVGDRVVAAGGVIVNQPSFFTAVARRLETIPHPRRLQLLDAAPVEGALRLAVLATPPTPTTPLTQPTPTGHGLTMV